MNKNAIQKFAIWARNELIAQVSQRAYQYGIDESGFGDASADTLNGRLLTAEEKSQRQDPAVQHQTADHIQHHVVRHHEGADRNADALGKNDRHDLDAVHRTAEADRKTAARSRDQSAEKRAKHNLYATATTGRLIADNTGLPITLLLSHKQGGHQQINARIAYNEIDLVLLFTDPNTTDPWDDAQMIETIRHCDKQNVPIATNLASAEMFILGLQRGDLDWREMVHSKPKF